MARTLITVPPTAQRGQVIEVRALIAHPMETGFRPDGNGQSHPRNLIQRFVCRYNNEVVFSAQLHAAIAANPYFSFHTVATESGTLTFSWEGDHGFLQTDSAAITVT